MMKIKLSQKALTIGDVIKAEQGFQSTAQVVDFLARFVVDDAGQPMALDAARDEICELPVSDLPALAAQLTEQIKSWQESAVPLPTSTN